MYVAAEASMNQLCILIECASARVLYNHEACRTDARV